jgi:urease accessory protein UreF
MDAEPQRAAAQLRALMARTRAAVDRVVGSWHVHQLLGLLAQLEADQGYAAAAAELDERAATDAKIEMRGFQHAAASAFAQAALRRLELGELDPGMALAKQAFELADILADPSPVYDQLVAMVRHVRQRESPSGA